MGYGVQGRGYEVQGPYDWGRGETSTTREHTVHTNTHSYTCTDVDVHAVHVSLCATRASEPPGICP